jgi:uncharacterized membrane protein (DUF2068 family)
MAVAQPAAWTKRGRESSATLFLIAIFKLLKGVALVIAGVGALHFIHRDIAQTVSHWIDVLRVDPDNRFIHKFLIRLLRVNPKQLEALSAGTFLYAALFLTEGTGLLLRKRWAEYLTIISTASLIPVEIYEFVERFTALKFAVMLANVAIVAYLVTRVRRTQ